VTGDELSVLRRKWTAAKPQTQRGDAMQMTLYVFPADVTAIGEDALSRFEVLDSVACPGELH
jgi:hypothetical protein